MKQAPIPHGRQSDPPPQRKGKIYSNTSSSSTVYEDSLFSVTLGIQLTSYCIIFGP